MNFEMQYDIRRRTQSDIWEHLPFLYDTACVYDKPRIIELGVRTGNSTSAFLAAADRTCGHLWSVDVEEPRVPAYWRTSDLWTLLVGDDTDLSLAAQVHEAVAPGADVLFIDTSHEYRHTLDELALYVPMVKPGGIVLMHDTEWGGRDVVKALDKYCPAHGLEWTNRPGNNGLGVIRIPEEAEHGTVHRPGHAE